MSDIEENPQLSRRRVGYQVTNHYAEHPFGFLSFQVIECLEAAIRICEQARSFGGVWFIMVILDGDIEEPEFISGWGR